MSLPASPPDIRPIPMTAERALTALAQARAAVVRAQHDVAEALEIVGGRTGSRPSNGQALAEAGRILHVAATLKQLDAVRDELFAADRDAPSPGVGPSSRPGPAREPSEAWFEGEFPPFEERLVVSPAWGHLHRRRIRQGRPLDAGTVIADIRIGSATLPVRITTAGSFVSWLASEGETVETGRPLARLRPWGARHS